MVGQRRVRSALLGTLATLALLAAGFAGQAAPATAVPFCDPPVRFAPGAFSRPTRIDNRFLPLLPGTQLVFEGGAEGEPHRIVFIVTGLTKVIAGVRSVVVWDRDFGAGELLESELAFFAQDDRGNVWNLGEYPEEFEDGAFVGAPSTWIAGVDGAEAGVHMLANPRPDTPWYLQGYAPEIDFLDCAKVVEADAATNPQGFVPGVGFVDCGRVDRSQTNPFACFEEVLVTKEESPLEDPGEFQLKYHAPGVGIVQIGPIPDPKGTAEETLVLVGHRRLDGRALARVNDAALALDRRGCRFSEVYRQTCDDPAR